MLARAGKLNSICGLDYTILIGEDILSSVVWRIDTIETTERLLLLQ